MYRPLPATFFLLFLSILLRAQPFSGGITLGGTASDRLLDLTASPTGYYAVGSYQATWPIANTLQPARGGSDAYLLALDSLLQPQWARTWGSPSDDECTHIASTATGLYTATFFWDSLTIDTLHLTAPSSALAILRWTHDGRIVWARVLTGNGIKQFTGLSANGGWVRVVGYFSDSLSANGASYTASGLNDAFALTLDTLGRVRDWQQWGNTGQTRAWAIAPQPTPSGQWHVAVGFDGTATFGDSVLQSGARDWDAVVLAYDTAGQWQWLQELAGVGDVRISALAQQAGRLWVSGHYINSLAVADSFFVTARNDFDTYLFALDALTGDWVRGRTWGGSDDEYNLALQASPRSLTLGGYFFGTAFLGNTPLSGDPFVPSGYVLAVDSLLRPQSAVAVGDPSAEAVVAAFAERPQSTTLALGGVYSPTLSITPNVPLISNGSNDGYILQYPTSLLTAVRATAAAPFRLYPNPVQNALHAEGIPPAVTVRLFDTMGREVRTWYAPQWPLDLSGLPSGFYLLRWTDRHGHSGAQKLWKVSE